MKVSIIIFTLNEIDGIKIIMPKLDEVIYLNSILNFGKNKIVENRFELIVVDGGSTDGTVEWFKDLYIMSNHTITIKIFIQKEKGMGSAYREAMERVTGDVVILFTPDGNSMPEAIPKLLEKIEEGNDIVIASRYLLPAISFDDDIVTGFGNWCFTKLINLLFGGKVTDALVIYRAYRVDAIRKIGVDTSLPSFGSSILIKGIKAGLRIAEISADEPARIGGVRKMRPVYNGLCELRMIFREWRRK